MGMLLRRRSSGKLPSVIPWTTAGAVRVRFKSCSIRRARDPPRGRRRGSVVMLSIGMPPSFIPVKSLSSSSLSSSSMLLSSRHPIFSPPPPLQKSNATLSLKTSTTRSSKDISAITTRIDGRMETPYWYFAALASSLGETRGGVAAVYIYIYLFSYHLISSLQRCF